MRGPRQNDGSILRGQVEVPNCVSFTYEPAEIYSAGYRDPANRSVPKLSVTYQFPGFFRRRETTLRVFSGTLTVGEPPSEKRFAVRNIEQLYVGSSSRSGKFSLMLRGERRDHVLIDELPMASHGAAVERLVEEFLAIENQPGLDADVRLATKSTRIIADSGKLHAEIVESEAGEGLAHLRIRTKGPSWSMVFLFGFLMVHNTFFFGGLLAGFVHGLAGLIGGLSIGAFWGVFFLRAVINRARIIADDHTLVVQNGPILAKKLAPLAFQDILEVQVRKSAVKVNGSYQYNVFALTTRGDIKLFPYLPRKQAQMLGRILRRQLKEARQTLAEKERLRVRVADGDVGDLEADSAREVNAAARR